MVVKTIRVVPLILSYETRGNMSMREFTLDLKYDLNNQQIKDPCAGAHRYAIICMDLLVKTLIFNSPNFTFRFQSSCDSIRKW